MIIFQLTTSRRGRPTLMSFAENAYTNFNSLPHAEVDGKLALNPIVFEPFQLTTSRRGRQSIDDDDPYKKRFQLTTSRRGRQQFVTKSMDINHRFHNKSHNKSLFFALIILCLSIFH